MARQSTSSSSAISSGNSNGHPPPPTSTTPPKPSDGYDFDFTDPRHHARNIPTPNDASLLPTGNRSLSSISLQAFWLGFTLALSLLSTAYLTLLHPTQPNPLWRLPAFFACLSLFHFLEFYTTARYNLPATRASSFLLFSNGRAYNTAHCLATLEILLSNFFPAYQNSLVYPYTIAIGLALVIVGQATRSIAMAQAGTNFNNTPVQTRKEDHVLVTKGMYNYSRHPSYFGFFWWALGTQLLVGNKVCVVGYAGALWWFFYQRIIGEFETCV